MAKHKLTATQRLRNNIRQQIRRMENRGYRIDTEIKDKIKTAKYQTLKSYQRNRYAKLYAGATALSEQGEIVSGSEFRKEERKATALKAARTRKREKAARQIVEDFGKQDWARESEQDWLRQRRIQDERDRVNAQRYQEGEIAYDEIQSLIGHYPTKGSDSLRRALSREIEKYGKENVLMAIGQSPQEVIANARTIMYYEDGADAIHSAFLDLFGVITGTKATDEEAKELGDTLDAMTDFESR